MFRPTLQLPSSGW